MDWLRDAVDARTTATIAMADALEKAKKSLTEHLIGAERAILVAEAIKKEKELLNPK